MYKFLHRSATECTDSYTPLLGTVRHYRNPLRVLWEPIQTCDGLYGIRYTPATDCKGSYTHPLRHVRAPSPIHCGLCANLQICHKLHTVYDPLQFRYGLSMIRYRSVTDSRKSYADPTDCAAYVTDPPMSL
eukprot:3689656-Pyramimonas_sp.AAC.1